MLTCRDLIRKSERKGYVVRLSEKWVVQEKVPCFYGHGTDTLSFKKAAHELVADKKLGYKYVSADEAKVQTYTFNYLHGLALDKYLRS